MAAVIRRVQTAQSTQRGMAARASSCCRRRLCSAAPATRPSPLTALREERAEEISQLAEVLQRERFQRQLNEAACQVPAGATQGLGGMSTADAELALDAGFLTFLTHVESRISSAVGQGFYTIGPCGEELMAAVGCALRPTDAMALHYRHLATQIARQLRNGRSVEQVLLDRARGHVVSASDPVTGGVHCSIGGGPTDFIVSSTLASQCPQAVGRALGNQLAHGLPGMDVDNLLLPKDAVSLVSVGDGSVNNGHFLSAVNLAGYARHRGYKCPTVFVVTDNEVCISLRGHGWIQPFVSKLHMPLHKADGMDLASIYEASTTAIDYARHRQGSVCLLVENVPRRFGHAATDRQAAYLSADEISVAQHTNPLEGAVAQLIAEHGKAASNIAADLATKFARFTALAEEAFDVAAAEDKITEVNHMIYMNSAPLATVELAAVSETQAPPTAKQNRPAVMRKHMTSVIAETLDTCPAAVYIGEDVEHGGYYLVTDGLAKAFPNRVRDFPPDETSLVGAAIGFSQVGLLPICEIPYAKYLDCGFDQFEEAAIAHWLSAGQSLNGMLIRLQGFDRGVFGGNFHTHNTIHIPPGLDVVCYSNGRDYVRGWRYCMAQASAGRVVMSVDCTALLNQRHFDDPTAEGGRRSWMTQYPHDRNDSMSFDEVTRYVCGMDGADDETRPAPSQRVAVVTYGNGVVTALQAVAGMPAEEAEGVVVIDTPYLSAVPQKLREAMADFDVVLFAEICKDGPGAPLLAHACALHNEGQLPRSWGTVAAARAYNPLGSTITFLSGEDIVAALRRLRSSSM